jgi:hypothetical protein
LLSDQFLHPVSEEAEDAMEESQQRVTRASVRAGKQRASISRQEEPHPDDVEQAGNVAARVAEGMRWLRRERDAEKVEVNEYGWALNQSMLYRPTFQIFWNNMGLKRFGRY